MFLCLLRKENDFKKVLLLHSNLSIHKLNLFLSFLSSEYISSKSGVYKFYIYPWSPKDYILFNPSDSHIDWISNKALWFICFPFCTKAHATWEWDFLLLRLLYHMEFLLPGHAQPMSHMAPIYWKESKQVFPNTNYYSYFSKLCKWYYSFSYLILSGDAPRFEMKEILLSNICNPH